MADGQKSPVVAGKPKRASMVGALAAAAGRARITLDGWTNVLTGLGTWMRDKRLGSKVEFNIMQEPEAEALYGGDDIAAKIVDCLPEDGLREGIALHVGGDDGAPQDDDGATSVKGVEDKLTELGAATKLRKAWAWSRLYGGAALLMGIDDSKALDEPLELDGVRDLRSLTVLSRWELRIGSMSDLDLDFMSPRYGQPVWYHFSPRRGGAANSWTRIHHSRLIRFDGADLPLRLFIQNQYWGDSVLNRAQNAIRNYQTAHDAAATVMQEFNQGVFKIKGLADMLMNGQDDAVQARLTALNMARSICRAVVIDEDETFTNEGARLAGVDALLDRIAGRLVVAANMPHDKILGDSPSGLGATGESENRVWYDFVAAQQELVLRAPYHRLIEIIFRSRKGPTAGVEPDAWGFDFNPLWQMDDKELGEVRKSQAETDEIYIRNNVLDADEVAISRFGSGKWSNVTRIDLAARQSKAGEPDAGDDNPDAPPAPPVEQPKVAPAAGSGAT